MTDDATSSRLSDADLIGQGRSIIYQSSAPTDPTLIRKQLDILHEWVSRHRVVSPADWVEMDIARWLIEELGIAASPATRGPRV